MKESKVTQLCPTLSDPMDCSPPGSSIHGIFQARVLEWGATAFSGNGKPGEYSELRDLFLTAPAKPLNVLQGRGSERDLKDAG